MRILTCRLAAAAEQRKALEFRKNPVRWGASPPRSAARHTRRRGQHARRAVVMAQSVSWTHGQMSLHLHDLPGSKPVIAACFCTCTSPEGGASMLQCLCVLDAEFVSMYMPNGETHTISTPCKALGLWPLPRGMLIEIAEPGAPCTSPLPAAKPTPISPRWCSRVHARRRGDHRGVHAHATTGGLQAARARGW